MQSTSHYMHCRYCSGLNPVYVPSDYQEYEQTSSENQRNEEWESYTPAEEQDANQQEQDSGRNSPNEEPSAVDLITFSYKYKTVRRTEVMEGEQREPETCSICLCGYEENCAVRRLQCMHLFHTKCVDKWLEDNMNCPICRLSLYSTPSEGPSTSSDVDNYTTHNRRYRPLYASTQYL